jgi:hypothetical protein
MAMIKLRVEAHYIDGSVCYIREAPALPPGVCWVPGLWYVDNHEGNGFQVDFVYVEVDGRVEVLFEESYASCRSEENDKMFIDAGWKVQMGDE